MTYKKDPNITYTQMAMWVDANAYTEGCDTETMYKYIYFLSLMLAKKRKFFIHNDDYDKFALYCAGMMLHRYSNSKQFEIKDDGTPKLPKIKSVLNYLTKSLHLRKIDFQNNELFVKDSDTIIYLSHRDLGEYIVDNTNLFDQMNFYYTLGDIDTIVREHLSHIPYKKDDCEWHNIYMSCLLTLLNCITVTITEQRKFDRLDANELEKVYTNLRYQEPILFHLDDKMSNYIRVLVNELRHCLAEALSFHSDTYISSDDTIKGIIEAMSDSEELLDEY